MGWQSLWFTLGAFCVCIVVFDALVNARNEPFQVAVIEDYRRIELIYHHIHQHVHLFVEEGSLVVVSKPVGIEHTDSNPPAHKFLWNSRVFEFLITLNELFKGGFKSWKVRLSKAPDRSNVVDGNRR